MPFFKFLLKMLGASANSLGGAFLKKENALSLKEEELLSLICCYSVYTF